MNQTPEQLQFIAQVKENERLIYKAITTYCFDTNYHDDLYQDVMFIAWRSFHLFRNDCKFSSWIYIIAKNAALTRYQLLKNRVKHLPFHNIFYDIESVPYEEVAIPSVDHLSAKERKAIELRIYGYSYKQMAEIMNEPENRLRVRINRIIDRLQKSQTP